MDIKNKLYKRTYKSFSKEKDPHKNENYERQFKTYRNLTFLNLHFKHISNHFNNFFTSIAEIINRNIVKAKKTHLSYIDPEKINTVSMKTNKASGPNSTPTNIFKPFNKEFSKPLSGMINMSFNWGVSPNILKLASVIPIHGNDKVDCNNYRPIFLLYNISKVYEKSMHIRLINFLRKNKLLFCYQFGFRNGHAINYALTSLTNLIRKALDGGKFECGVFIDLQKVFDNVDHEILLWKLYYYGVKGPPH